jgi:predicted DNA-binding transcriptional regulator AlpA
MTVENDRTAGDLLIGARAIALFLGVTPRQVYHLAEQRTAPSFKVGGSVAARKSSLNSWLDAIERSSAKEDTTKPTPQIPALDASAPSPTVGAGCGRGSRPQEDMNDFIDDPD